MKYDSNFMRQLQSSPTIHLQKSFTEVLGETQRRQEQIARRQEITGSLIGGSWLNL